MSGPLEGMKVLDFTTLLPGPYATMILADMGADVLRVVSGSRPDLNALMPPFVPGTTLTANCAFLWRGKRCLTLNLKHAQAVQIVYLLIQQYDIIIEQFRPGVMAKFGLDYETLRERYPNLIYCSLTGYGQNGPMKQRAGHDINYLSRSGLMSYSGRKDSGPCLTGAQIADIACGSYNAVMGILAAVYRRSATGEGQYIDVAMTDGAIALNAMTGAAFLVDGKTPQMEGTLLNGGTLYDFYETKDGRYLSVGSLEPQFFKALCEALGRPDLIAGGVAPANLERVKGEIKAIFKQKTMNEWMAIFEQTDACVEPVMNLDEALDQPQAHARNMIIEVRTPDGRAVRQLATPIFFSKTPCEYGAPGEPAGTHNRETLLELGYNEEQIEEFGRKGLFS